VVVLALTKVLLPQNVNGETGAVFCNDSCAIAMRHVGFENRTHEYSCGAEPGECEDSSGCSKYRYIPADSGLFQKIPFNTEQIQEAHDIRKNCERPESSWKLSGYEVNTLPWLDVLLAVLLYC
jgi:hypothetical protein